MTSKIHTTNYSSMNEGMSALLATGQYTSVLINVFTDADGKSLLTDENGAVSGRRISQIRNTASHTNPTTNQVVPGFITLNFSDGSSLTTTDGNDDHWYTLQGVPFVRKTFNNLASN